MNFKETMAKAGVSKQVILLVTGCWTHVGPELPVINNIEIDATRRTITVKGATPELVYWFTFYYSERPPNIIAMNLTLNNRMIGEQARGGSFRFLDDVDVSEGVNSIIDWIGMLGGRVDDES